MASAEETREQQRQSWDRFSSGWEKWDHLVLPMLQPVGDEMLRMLAVDESADHLDVASGTGEPGLTIAAVAGRGQVMLTDLATGMLDVARRKATERGITNVEIRECSADDLPFADASFDSISCRMGMMFFPDLEGAARELTRVLRPGGRICVAVWAEPEGNPWATIPMGAIASEVDMPPPPPGSPGLFRCAAPGAVSTLLESAGMHDAEEVDVQDVLSVASADEYWRFMTDVAAAVVAGLAQVDDAAGDRIRARVVDKISGFEIEGQPRIPLHARCIVATR